MIKKAGNGRGGSCTASQTFRSRRLRWGGQVVRLEEKRTLFRFIMGQYHVRRPRQTEIPLGSQYVRDPEFKGT